MDNQEVNNQINKAKIIIIENLYNGMKAEEIGFENHEYFLLLSKRKPE